jgi:hypothetical protein
MVGISSAITRVSVRLVFSLIILQTESPVDCRRQLFIEGSAGSESINKTDASSPAILTLSL